MLKWNVKPNYLAKKCQHAQEVHQQYVDNDEVEKVYDSPLPTNCRH
jgi:hypothetical protein